MEELPGQRPGSAHYHHGGFCYNRDARTRIEIKYICVKKTQTNVRCNAVLARSLRGEISLRGQHNHAPDPMCTRKRAMKNELKRLVAETQIGSARVIYDILTRRYLLCYKL